MKVFLFSIQLFLLLAPAMTSASQWSGVRSTTVSLQNLEIALGFADELVPTEEEGIALVSILEPVAAFYKNDFAVPRQIQVYLQASGTGAATGGLNAITIGYLFGDSPVYFFSSPPLTDDVSFTYPILIHEMGHLVFRRTLVKSGYLLFRKIDSIEKRMFSYEEQAELFDRKIDELSASSDGKNTNGFDSKIQQLITNKEYFYKRSSELNDLFEADAAGTRPYDELFADIFAILFLQDPQAISRIHSLESVTGGESLGRMLYRDFTLPRDRLTDFEVNSNHLTLNDARRYLWGSTLSQVISSDAATRARVARRILNVMAEMPFEANFENDRESSDKMNKVLIEKLKAAGL